MSYIDLLYVHFWDMATSTEEMMLSLNRLVTAGKALYLGISDTPTWFVVMCDDYARQHGLRPFSVYQGRWSAAERDFERDIIPMCIDQGMAPVPRGALGGGRFKLKSQPQQDGDGRKLTPSTARRAGWRTSCTRRPIYVFPVCGGRKIEHLRENIASLGPSAEPVRHG
jgi:aryl-alcohol dehydrogenase-like predicted oxidoreductase